MERLIKTVLSKSLFLLLTLIFIAGCRPYPQFPCRAMRVKITNNGEKLIAFDTNKDKKPDYWQLENLDGHKEELRFAKKGLLPEETVKLNEIHGQDVPHFIIALDGVPYTLVQELYDQGRFRLFYRPSRVVSSFPGMTDVAFQRIFGGHQPIAYQANHFDRQNNRLISGDDLYLSGQAANWSKILDYRVSFKLDTVAYINPQLVFDHELRGMMEVFRRDDNDPTKIVYSVATAGLGTRDGREGILRYLRIIDQFCEQIVYEKRGRVKITLLADHGHNMSGRGRVSFEQLLEDEGYRLNTRLDKPKDVVAIQYGLVTYASFHTNDPAGVARVILQDPATSIACYRQGESVIVKNIAGSATIRKGSGGYSYDTTDGDPLALQAIIAQLSKEGHVSANGIIDDRALFHATINHIYPDPLRRIYLAFNGLVQKPADLIVTLKDGWVHGSKFFQVMIGGATSTHGGLNQINSMTFAMTMWDKLPKDMRLEEVMPAVNSAREKNLSPR